MTGQDPKPGCCPKTARHTAPPVATWDRDAREAARPATCAIPGGTALVGTAREHIPNDGEGPLRRVKLKPFEMDATAVTNARFESFVRDTGYVTEAERFGWSFVFWSNVPDSIAESQALPEAPWWRRIDGATWFAPHGPGTEGACLPDHPVTQVSHADALAFATWAGGKLPSEAQWEHAARGGLGDVKFPWGDEDPTDDGPYQCNIWQGQFPRTNTAADGWATTAPAQSFEPNGYGLYNMVGNVWEWTSDLYRIRSLKKAVKDRLRSMPGYRLSKGGSFLCHRSYCYRYRIAARSGTSPDSATTHHGFRLIYESQAPGPSQRP